MDKHTPGPWRRGQIFRCEGKIVMVDGEEVKTDPSTGNIEVRSEGFLWVADVHGPHVRVPIEQAEANADLIAAAPDMYAHLVEALDLLPRINDDDPMAPALAEWCRRVRATICPEPPLSGLHINAGSLDAAAHVYEREYAEWRS